MLAVVASACSPGPRPTRIVLVTLDTLRWDAFAPEGVEPSAMPELARWAEEARVFERHHAVTSTTGPTHATLLTGAPPWRHGITRNGLVLEDAWSTLPERAREAGFETGAVVASFPLHRRFGFDQGFDRYHDEFDQSFLGLHTWKGERIPDGRFFTLADTVTARALALLDASGDGDQLFFFHYFDPHAPYGSTGDAAIEVADITRAARQGEAAVQRALADARRRYREDVRFLDRSLARLLERLARDEERFETHVFVVSDHGESFGEDGVLAHGSRVSPEQIRVPLIVRSPLLTPGRETGTTGSVDVALAIARIAGVGEDAPLLTPIEEGRRVCGMRRTFETRQPERRTDGRRVVPPPLEFYCAVGDRIHRGDGARVVADDGGPIESPLAEQLAAAFGAFEVEMQGRRPAEVLDAETLDALRALGYAR